MPFPRQRSHSFHSQYKPTQSTTQTSAAESSATVSTMANATTDVTTSRNRYRQVAREIRFHATVGPWRDRRHAKRNAYPAISKRNRSPYISVKRCCCMDARLPAMGGYRLCGW